MSSREGEGEDGENQNEKVSVSNEIDQPIKRLRLATSSASPPLTPPKPLQCTPNNLWHLRFAHASQYTLAKHPGIESTYDTSDCLACRRGKHHQNPHRPSKSAPREIVELIHSDICGPFPMSKGGNQYLVTFLDDASHYLVIYTVPDK